MSTTTLVTNRAMLAHRCEWDANNIERPSRLKVILDCLDKGEVCDGFTRVEGESADIDDILLVQTKEYVAKIEEVCGKSIDEMENYCAHNEDIYLNESTFKCALMSAGSSIQAMKAVLGKRGHNSFAAVRPPGHHAWQDAGCGFCIFNNVAISLQLGCQRVLILDWDVHAGQGTQYCIAGEEQIQLISSHRYEEGRFWPQLPESGIRNKYPNTINLPLNEVGAGDAEYIYFLNRLILPVISDFKPELILLSCGFDAALGDPEGEMKITPAGYGTMLGHLAAMQIPLCVLLEGGYFLESVKESFKFCMEALVHKRPPLPLALEPPKESFKDQVLRTMIMHQGKFPIVERLIHVLQKCRALENQAEIEVPLCEYFGEREYGTPPYPTRNVYKPRPEGVESHFRDLIKELVLHYDELRAETNWNAEPFYITGQDNVITLRGKDQETTITNATQEEVALLFFTVVQELQTDFRRTKIVVNGSELPFPVTLDDLQKQLKIRAGSVDAKADQKMAEFLRALRRNPQRFSDLRMLADVIPISVKLEIVRGAPFVDISPSEGPSKKVEQVPTVPVWNMPPKRRNKKSASRSETSAGAPLAPPVKMQHSGTDNVTLDKDACMGRRTYSEVVVETIKPTQQPSSSRKVMASCLAQPSRGSSEPAAVVEKIAYYCGNPTVEKTTGLLHFYKKSDNDVVLDEELNMLCMLAVPATITCQDLIDFVTPQMEKIMEMKIIRDSTPNQYMVLLKMRSHVDACSFFYEYNGRNFWEHDENVCSLVFVERVESISADDKGSLPFSSLTELPTCAVCLERMDDDVLTILCNHSFHARCLKQWTDYTCPVCRYLQTPEVTREQPCNDCDKTSDLWMCLICGNIGCGRYAEAHAYQHFLKTQHTYTLEVGGDKVWDYAGDNYVHRLIQVGSENKFAEIEHNACGREDGDKNVEKLQVEYACLMTNQLETQRHFFEEKMRQTEERLKAESKVIQSQIGSLSGELNEVREQNENLKKKVKELTHEKSAVEKKNNNVTTKLEKTQLELEEERVVTKVLRADIEKLHKKIEQLETSNAATKAACLQEMNEYQEQIRDLMAHFNAQVLLKDEITEAESAEASVTVGEAPKPAPTPTRRQRKHKK